ncbi:BCCT family transporter [Salinicoccus albus]|uniref:BCCT family transporter n=1 Tax=Salinicoccus albus TaxID=418756 RepID=UPI0003761CF4|nr:BCCT family transporter [Salinicoccus albus]
MKKNNLMDWPTFIVSLLILLSVVIPLIVFPEASNAVIMSLNSMVTTGLGAVYLALGLAVFLFIIYIAFGKYGHVTLGEPSDTPEFGTLSWAAMLFCAGIGSSILYWGVIEWVYYYQAPPFHLEPESEGAINYASTYGIFHWGPIAWAIYVMPALPIAYSLYVKKTPILKISLACAPILGKYTTRWPGKLIDILFIFGLLGGAGTTLGLGTPMIAAGIEALFGIDGENIVLRSAIMLTATLIFAFSAYSGLRRGIKLLSDINVWLTFILIAFAFVVGPSIFLMETTVSSVGLLIKDFFRMATWLEPFGGQGNIPETSFPQNWTVFYWAWWLVYAPFVGLFIARISKGRNLKEVILGALIYGTLGCVLFFGVLGNYGLWLELSGTFSVTDVLAEQSGEDAIIAVVGHLPMGDAALVLFLLTAIIYLATTFDSGSYILAGTSQTEVDGEPHRGNRLFWAFALSLLPFSLMLIGGDDSLSLLQTSSIVAGVPLIIIFIMLMVSFMKTLSRDRIKLEERARLYEEQERKRLTAQYDKRDRWWE